MTNLNTLPGFSVGGGGGSVSSLATAAGAISSLTLDNNRPNAITYNYTSGVIAGQCATAGNLKSRNVFARWMQWMDTSANTSGFTINSFSIDRATGALTQLQSGPQDIWVNTSGAAMSTTYCAYDPMHGCFISGGNNAYPGYGSHVMGYTAGQLNSAGLVVGGQSAYTGGDHASNGTYCSALPQGSGTQYFANAGYYTSYAGGRLNEGTSTGITIGTQQVDGSWTSGSGMYQCIYQPDVNTTPTGHVNSARGTSFQSPNYGRVEYRGNSPTNVTAQNGSNAGILMCGHNGTTLLGWSTFFGTPGVSSASFSSLSDGVRDVNPNNFMSQNGYGTEIVGIGNNMFLHFGVQVPDKKVELLKIDSNQDISSVARFNLSTGDPSILDAAGGTTHNFVVFETDTSPYPKWLVRTQASGGDVLAVNSYELAPDFSTY